MFIRAWLKELEATDPDTASQVHVLNSFFYKKLNKRKYGLVFPDNSFANVEQHQRRL